MKDILTYMENNPWMTFFLACIVASAVVGIFKAFAVCVRGWPKKDETSELSE